METIFQIIYVLEKGCLYRLDLESQEILRQGSIEELLEALKELIHKAEILLPEVCELTKDAAENYSKATSTQFKSMVTGNSAAPYIQLSLDASPTEASNEDSPILHVMEEPVKITAADENTPFIPASLIDIERYSIVLHLQLAMQRLTRYSEASAKARSNAAYIAGLRSVIEELFTLVTRKLQLEKVWRDCNHNICLTDIAPDLLARQLTLIDARIYQSLPLDLLRENEPGRDFAQESKDFAQFVCSVVQFEVLAPKEPSDRVKALNHWIGIALELDKLHSFSMLKAVSDAINSAGVANAKGLRNGLNTNREYEMRKLKERMSLKGNYMVMRKEIEALAFKQGGIYAVPFITSYLTELDMLYSSRTSSTNRDRSTEIGRIVDLLVFFQDSCKQIIETIEPNAVAQHWILTRPYKNSQELDNLATSRSSSGGLYSPSSRSPEETPPNIIDFGDEGRILFDGVANRIYNDLKQQSR